MPKYPPTHMAPFMSSPGSGLSRKSLSLPTFGSFYKTHFPG